MVMIWHHINALWIELVSDAVCSNAVVPLLSVAPIVCGGLVFGQCLVMLYLVNNLVFQSSC